MTDEISLKKWNGLKFPQSRDQLAKVQAEDVLEQMEFHSPDTPAKTRRYGRTDHRVPKDGTLDSQSVGNRHSEASLSCEANGE